MNNSDEDLIWCKQSLLRVLVFVSLQRTIKIDELCAMLNDVETGRYESDAKAIGFFIKALEALKEDD